MSRRQRLISLILIPLGLAVAAVAVNHHVGLPDRIAAAKRRVAMDNVRDELLRYEAERGALPETLDELVPGYILREMLQEDGAPLYAYDRAARRIAEVQGSPIRGLIEYRMGPYALDLPPPDPAPARTDRSGLATIAPPADPNIPAKTGTGETRSPPTDPPADTKPRPNPKPAFRLAAPKGPDLPAPPEGCLVFEAEHYSDTNYGWEVHPDGACSGGAYLHCKEGIANGPGQVQNRVGDFYNVRATMEYTFLRYHLHLEKAGTYYVYGRMWTTDTHCSNNVCASFDTGGPHTGGMENRTPFRWLWSPMKGNPVPLSAGDHFFHIFIHEDGLRFDQFILSPRELDGSQAYAPNVTTGAGTAWRAKDGPAFHLSYDLKSMVFTRRLPPECSLVLRRVREAKGVAAVEAVLEAAGAEGEDGAGNGGQDDGGARRQDVLVASGEVDLAALPEVALVPLDFSALGLEKLPRREYLLRASLKLDGKPIAETRIPLMHPFAWEVFGPGRYLRNDRVGPLDGDGAPRPDDKRRWTPFADGSWDWFGVLDFGVQAIGNSKHAPPSATIYARTRIHVPKTGTYLLKAQADDQMIVWLDGREIHRHDADRPVTRAADRVPVRLEAGDHRLRIRVNQNDGPWQASLRIRTKDDECSEVTGLAAEPAGEGK